MSDFEAEGRDALDQHRVVFRVSDAYAARIAQRNKQRQVRRRISTVALAAVCVAGLLAIPFAGAVLGNDPATRLDAAGRLQTRLIEPDADGASGASASGAPEVAASRDTRSGAAPSSSSTLGTEPEPSVVVGGPAPNGTSAQTARAAPAARAGSTGRKGTGTASVTGPAVTTTPLAQLSDAEPASTGAEPAPGGPGAAAGNGGSPGEAGAECIAGPDTLAVGEEGVFSKAGGSTPPYSWTPEAPGAFTVVLEAQAEGTTCLKAVTVTPADETTPTGSNAPAPAAAPDLTSGDRWSVVPVSDSFSPPLLGT